MAENEITDLSVMERVEICLNFQGEDYTVIVDLETANVLLNDPDEADRFMRHELKLEACVPEVNNDDCEVPNEEPNSSNANPSVEGNVVWSTRKPTAKDNEATEFFLDLRKKYSNKFNDRKTQKGQVWLQIGRDMNSAGYCVGEGKEAIEKMRLKFANLQKQYLNYMKHVHTTGETRKDPPVFYELLHAILGDKDKVNPCRVEDSADEMSTPSTSSDNTESQPTSATIKSRFHSQSTTELKPKTYNSKLLDLMKEQHVNDREERREQFQKLENILQQQNRQNEEFLNMFKRLVDLKSRKRRHSSSSDE